MNDNVVGLALVLESPLEENDNYKVVTLEPSVELVDGSIFNYSVVNKTTGKQEFRGAALPQVIHVADELNAMLLQSEPEMSQLDLPFEGTQRPN